VLACNLLVGWGVRSVVRRVRDFEPVKRLAGLAVAAGLACTACTSGTPQSSSPRPRPSLASPVAHQVLKKLHQQRELRFGPRSGPAGYAVTVLTASRSLQPGQHGVVLRVRGVGNLMGSCSPGHPAMKFRVTNRRLAGPPVVTEIRKPVANPVGLYLLGFQPTYQPVGGRQQFTFIQVVGGGDSADFSLAVWATLTPVARSCAFSANGILRVRGSNFLHRLG
jgi:hypothetical protein